MRQERLAQFGHVQAFDALVNCSLSATNDAWPRIHDVGSRSYNDGHAGTASIRHGIGRTGAQHHDFGFDGWRLLCRCGQQH